MKRIAAEELLAYRRCRRQPYLQHFGPQDRQSPPSDFLNQLRQGRQQHRNTVKHYAPGIDLGGFNRNSWPELCARVLRTLELMEAGEERIYRGVLMHPLNLPGNPVLVSRPDILVRTPLPEPIADSDSANYQGKRTRFKTRIDLETRIHSQDRGVEESDRLHQLPRPDISVVHPRQRRWYYLPADVRASKRVKSDYTLVLALHSELLQLLWGVEGERAIAILLDGKWRRVGLRTAKQNARRLLMEYVGAMAQKQAPEAHVTRSRCSLCAWQEHCRDLARVEHPLTLLPGVTATIYATLRKIGIVTVEALAATASDRIQHLPGIGRPTAERIICQAMAQRDGRALPMKAFVLPRSPVELYFDIEAEPQQNVAYLLGVLAVHHQPANVQSRTCPDPILPEQEATFHPFLAERPIDERDCWEQFVQLTQRYPTAPIYHFHAFEIHTCRQLSERYGTPRTVLRQILNRMVDLHEIASQCVVMPVESYSLKHMAKWQGFRWRQEDAGGAQAVYWYAQWLETGDRSFLDATITYNEDDCKATYHLKQWLEDWQAKHYPQSLTALSPCELPAS